MPYTLGVPFKDRYTPLETNKMMAGLIQAKKMAKSGQTFAPHTESALINGKAFGRVVAIERSHHHPTLPNFIECAYTMFDGELITTRWMREPETTDNYLLVEINREQLDPETFDADEPENVCPECARDCADCNFCYKNKTRR